MIPKIIHFCWLSDDKYPEKIRYCIESWKKFLPDYEIRLWDLSRFDINSSIWCKEAYNVRKYAFAADYIRCYALYMEGGIYLDSDVEVLKSFDDLLHLPYFIGIEQGSNIEPAVIGCEKRWSLMKEMLLYYKDRHFINGDSLDMQTLPIIMHEKIQELYEYTIIKSPSEFHLDEKKINVLPAEYFSPKYPNSFKCTVTAHTYTIHHFSASWYSRNQRIFRLIRKFFGYKIAHNCSLFIKKIRSFKD